MTQPIKEECCGKCDIYKRAFQPYACNTCSCHNPMQPEPKSRGEPPQPLAEWEECNACGGHDWVCANNVRNQIAEALSQQNQKLREKVEGMKEKDDYRFSGRTPEENRFNQALDEILSLID